MPTPEQIADALVEAGIVRNDGEQFTVKHQGFWTYICDSGPLRVYDEQLITDWRVAGAVLETMLTDKELPTVALSRYHDLGMWEVCRARSATPTYGVYSDHPTKTESLPRAILGAWWEARE